MFRALAIFFIMTEVSEDHLTPCPLHYIRLYPKNSVLMLTTSALTTEAYFSGLVKNEQL